MRQSNRPAACSTGCIPMMASEKALVWMQSADALRDSKPPGEYRLAAIALGRSDCVVGLHLGIVPWPCLETTLVGTMSSSDGVCFTAVAPQVSTSRQAKGLMVFESSAESRDNLRKFGRDNYPRPLRSNPRTHPRQIRDHTAIQRTNDKPAYLALTVGARVQSLGHGLRNKIFWNYGIARQSTHLCKGKSDEQILPNLGQPITTAGIT